MASASLGESTTRARRAVVGPLASRQDAAIVASMRRLFPLTADGPTQMAWDEALLAASDHDQPILRLYAWDMPTVSLGCFQEYAPIAARLPAGMPVVRRITGGGAIWHQHEITWALVGALGRQGFPQQSAAVYPWLHSAILRALVVAGARLATQDEAVGDRRYRSEPRCFASPAAGDLLGPAGGKVLGSAARTRGARILVHGSLKLASNPWDGPAVVGCGLDEAAAARALLEGFAAALGQELPEPQIPTPAETTAMESLRAARYGDRAWVERREGLRP